MGDRLAVHGDRLATIDAQLAIRDDELATTQDILAAMDAQLAINRDRLVSLQGRQASRDAQLAINRDKLANIQERQAAMDAKLAAMDNMLATNHDRLADMRATLDFLKDEQRTLASRRRFLGDYHRNILGGQNSTYFKYVQESNEPVHHGDASNDALVCSYNVSVGREFFSDLYGLTWKQVQQICEELPPPPPPFYLCASS